MIGLTDTEDSDGHIQYKDKFDLNPQLYFIVEMENQVE